MSRRRVAVVEGDDVRVSLGYGFASRFPRSSVVSAARETRRRLSIGAHGWRGRWLVNTSWHGLVTLHLDPPARGRLLGVPVRVREMTVSDPDPDGLVATLTRP